MNRWATIRYMGFWDVPRVFLVRNEGDLYLFDCPFNERLEDDEDNYQVYLMPEIPDDELPKDWTTLKNRAIRRLGEVPVEAVKFDETRKREVDLSILNRLAPDAALRTE